MSTAAMSPLAAVLERIDDDDASRARVLFCEPLSQALRAWVPGLELRPWSATERESLGGKRFEILLQGPGAELRLQLPCAIDAVTAALLAAGSWSAAVQLRCLQTHAGTALRNLVRYFEALGLQPVRLDTRPEPLAAGDGATMFSARLDRHRIEGRLHSRDARWLGALEAVLGRRRSTRGYQALAGLAMPLRVRLGTRRLALALLRSLEEGDVVLLDTAAQSAAGGLPAWLLAGSHAARGSLARACSLGSTELAITGDHWMSTPTVEPPSTSAEPAAADAIADLEIDLHFELQVLSTPLSELTAMKPGYVIELPVAAADAVVRLVAGGQILGRAQLVSVGDRLGARILELFHADR